MARKASATKANDRVRYTLELNTRLEDILEQIADKNGTTKAEAIRFAIDFLHAGVSAKEDGMKVGSWIEGKDGQHIKEREFVGLPG